MATGVVTWSKTAADNALADSAAPWPEGMAPSQVNDSARGSAASVAKWRDDLNGSIATAGSSTAYTATSNQSFAALTAGIEIACQFDEDCGATVTLNVDGLGAKPLRSAAGVELVAGAIKAGSVHRATYFTSNSGEWLLHDVNPTIIAANQVVTASINDDAVTYAKMQNVSATKRLLGRNASGAGDVEEVTTEQAIDFIGTPARGDILYRNATTTVRLPAGTAGQVLYTNGTGADPAWGASPGLVLISSQSASNSATIDFTTGLDDTYDAYEIVISSAKPQNDDVQLQMRIGTGGGPTYQTNTYIWGITGQATSSTASDGSGSDSKIGLSFAAGSTAAVGNASGENFNASIKFNNPEASDFMEVSILGAYSRSDNLRTSVFGGGSYKGAAPVTGVRFLFSSGNIASGRFTLYGYRKS